MEMEVTLGAICVCMGREGEERVRERGRERRKEMIWRC
jgi:hypothetical protein